MQLFINLAFWHFVCKRANAREPTTRKPSYIYCTMIWSISLHYPHLFLTNVIIGYWLLYGARTSASFHPIINRLKTRMSLEFFINLFFRRLLFSSVLWFVAILRAELSFLLQIFCQILLWKRYMNTLFSSSLVFLQIFFWTAFWFFFSK